MSDSNVSWPIDLGNPTAMVPTPFGELSIQCVQIQGHPILICVSEKKEDDIPIIRFQSSCVFGEGFKALDCDCGDQLYLSLELICKKGGILTYAWEEGRGVGIEKKIEAISMQQKLNLDTASAFCALGIHKDPRDFSNHISALRKIYLGYKVKVITRNPKKIASLRRAGYNIIEVIKLNVPMNEERKRYLEEKFSVLGHLR